MLKRDRRLRPLKEMVGKRENHFATRLAESERRLSEAEQRQQELLRYRLEYEQRFHARATAGAPMRGLREQQVFIARLGEAMRAQELVLEQLRAECASARLQWRAAATRKQAVGKVVDRAQAEEQVSENRRQQAENDERAQHVRPQHVRVSR